MGSAHRYAWTRADGTTGRAWRAAWVGADGRKRFKRGFDRQSDALAYAADREAEIRHGVSLEGEQASGKLTVRAWGDLWLGGLTADESTLANYRSCLNRVNATFGGRTLTSLRTSELRAWRKGMLDRYAESTTALTSTVFSMLLKAAAEDELLPKNPMPRAVGGGRSRRVVDPERLLTWEQVEAWDAALPDHARGMAVVAAATGLREGELLGLRVEDVDFLRRRIRVVQQNANGRYKAPKTEAGVRTVPLARSAHLALSAYLAAYPAIAGEPIFRAGKTGRRWQSRKGFWHCWSTARDKVPGLEGHVWHDLRDVTASALIRSGADIKTVMTIMGHASARETLETYARLWPDAQDVALKGLDAMLGIPAADSGSHGVATD